MLRPISTVTLLLLAAGAARAETPAAEIQIAQATPSAAARSIGQRIGVAGAVRGAVYLTPSGAGAVGALARSGSPVHLGDKVRSGPDAGLQVILLDETVFSIGPDAELSIDEFVFDPKTDAGTVAASITKGAFRFITGRVAIKDPQRMNVRLPQATIGVRGTMVAGEVRPADNVSEVVLLGPGPENTANDKIGAILVSNAAGAVMIERPGFATSIAMLAAPTPPAALPPERMRSLTGQSNVSAGPKPAAPAPGSGPAPAPQPGQPPAPGGQPPGPGQQSAAPPPPPPPPGIAPLRAPDAGMELVQARTFFESQTAILAPPPPQEQVVNQTSQQTQPLSLVTTFDQLRLVPSTATNFTIAGNPYNLAATAGSGSGFFGYSVVVSHATRTLALQVNANLTIGGMPYSGQVYAETIAYGSGPIPVGASTVDSPALKATLASDNIGDAPRFDPFFTSGGRKAAIGIEIQNNQATGRIFHQGTVTLSVNSGTNTLTGTGTAVRP